MPIESPVTQTRAALRIEILTKNNCLGDRVYRAGTEGPLVLGGFLPIPVALVQEAERLAAETMSSERPGFPALVAVDDLDRVQCLNVLGWVQPELDAYNRLLVTDGVPTRLWDKWTEIINWADIIRWAEQVG